MFEKPVSSIAQYCCFSIETIEYFCLISKQKIRINKISISGLKLNRDCVHYKKELKQILICSFKIT